MTFASLDWRLDPYPYATLTEPFIGAEYKALCDTFPEEELFERMPDNRMCEGKSVLSEHFHADAYEAFVGGCEPWAVFSRYVRTYMFLMQVFRAAQSAGVDLPVLRGLKVWPRFEFALMEPSSLDGRGGGYHPPHRDLTQKIATLTLFFPNPGDVIEEAEFKVLRPRGEGMTDYQAPLSAFEVVERVPYAANSGVLFLRGEASWHAVGPLGVGNARRRVVTVNVERTG